VPRFVILEHDHPQLHWDFLLEAGPVLRAWRLLGEPRPGAAVTAEANFDHRLLYLEYEGPLSGDRGCVTRWDEGSFDWLTDAEGEKAVRLKGRRLKEIARWRRVGDGWVWRLA
jgi:hypothetical protein